MASADPDAFDARLVEVCKTISNRYEEFKQSIRNGDLGLAPIFWLMYIDLMYHQHEIHIAVQENNFNQRIRAWDYFLPFYFATNKSNYARYGIYYTHCMKAIDQLYPGLRTLLENNCLSVQAQDRYVVRTTIDQRGEQTLNRDAKTTGGICIG